MKIGSISLMAVAAVMTLAAGAAVAAGGAQVTVPAGPFQMGCSDGDAACDKDEGPAGGTRVDVPAFNIDVREVTVAEYQRCMDGGACRRPDDHARNQYCNLDAPKRADHPMNCVDWSDAVDFCEYVGRRLPTEPEWEKAARAGTTTAYPWGTEVSCKQAILDDGVTRGSKGDEMDGCGEDRTWPVASRSANALGLFDMHGNAGEWTANWYAGDALSALYAKGDLSGPPEGRQKVARGGSWDENRPNLRSSFRNVKPPVSGSSVYGSLGFRCAADI